ncbi:MAG: hypothetical protein ABIN97_20695 [Ginsengibacter sp.]
MRKVPKQILIEVLWLVLSLAITILFASFLFGWSFLRSDVNIHLHDTYFVISRWLILPLIFFLLVFIVYFIKEFRKSFSSTLANRVLTATGLILIVLLTFLIQSFSQSLIGGWTLYPPLSVLGPDSISQMTQNPVTKVITNSLIVIQILVLVMLLFAAYQWGAHRRKESVDYQKR